MTARMPQTVVVVGGGIGGLALVRDLAPRLRGRHRLLLLEPQPVQSFGAHFTWVMVGYREPDRVRRDIRPLLPEGVEWRPEPVEGVDLEAGRVHTPGGPVPYDWLVLALGAETTLEAVPGLAESAHTFYTLEGARRLRDALESLEGGVVALVIPSLPFKCPPAPYDAILMAEDFFRRRGRRGRVELHLYTVEPAPIPVAGPKTCGRMTRLLEGRGIRLHPNHRLVAVDPEGRRLRFEGGVEAGYDLLIAVPVHRAPAAVRGLPIAGPGGWIPVSRRGMRTAREEVYAIGDVTHLPIAGGKTALPKAGVFARNGALAASADLRRRLLGRGPEPEMDGLGACFLSTALGEGVLVRGDFLAEPPRVGLLGPARVWHASKARAGRLWAQGRF